MNLKERGILYFCRNFFVQYEINEYHGEEFSIIWEFPFLPPEGEIPLFLTLAIPIHRNLPDSVSLCFRLEFSKEKVNIGDFDNVFPLWFDRFQSKLRERIFSESTSRAIKSCLSNSFGKYIISRLHHLVSNAMGKNSTIVQINVDYRDYPLRGKAFTTVYTDKRENCIWLVLYPEFSHLNFLEHFLFWFKVSGDSEEDTKRIVRIYNSIRDYIMSYPRENLLTLLRPVFEQILRECWRFSYNMIEEVKKEVDEIVRRSGRDFDETINALIEDFKIYPFINGVRQDEKVDFDVALHLHSPLNLHYTRWELRAFPYFSLHDKSKIESVLACNSHSKMFVFTLKTNDSSVLDNAMSLFSGEPKDVISRFISEFCVKVSFLPELYKPDKYFQKSLMEFKDFVDERWSMSSEGG